MSSTCCVEAKSRIKFLRSIKRENLAKIPQGSLVCEKEVLIDS